ncbi:MAG TPA: hypothetical protein VMP68_08465 [Candidatus Eisenbacteria bacterium]|nr:hypothetical protein [Candidatus Eisenbacteria bacterium]
MARSTGAFEAAWPKTTLALQAVPVGAGNGSARDAFYSFIGIAGKKSAIAYEVRTSNFWC